MRIIERFLDWYLVQEDRDELRPATGLVNAIRMGVLLWLLILAPFALAKLF